MITSINYLAVLLSAIVTMVLGSLWYGPFFGKSWTKMMGFTPEKMAATKAKGMGISYALMAVGSLLMSFVLSRFIGFSETASGVWSMYVGIRIAVFIWLGFVGPVTLGSVLWEGKPWKLWLINSSYYLVALLIMGAILATWT